MIQQTHLLCADVKIATGVHQTDLNDRFAEDRTSATGREPSLNDSLPTHFLVSQHPR